MAYTRILPLRLTKKRKYPFSFRKLTYVWRKSSSIFPAHIGRRFTILAGKKFYILNVVKEMVGHKFGEFVFTTRMGGIIHKAIKNKKRN